MRKFGNLSDINQKKKTRDISSLFKSEGSGCKYTTEFD